MSAEVKVCIVERRTKMAVGFQIFSAGVYLWQCSFSAPYFCFLFDKQGEGRGLFCAFACGCFLLGVLEKKEVALNGFCSRGGMRLVRL